MQDTHRFTRVIFQRFKAFESFVLDIKHFNLLVGPNNSGKSTILMAFRILEAGLRTAYTRKSQLLDGPDGPTPGYIIDLSALSVAEENLFFNYDDSQAATVTFRLSNEMELVLFFPEPRVAYLLPNSGGFPIHSTTRFKSLFNCRIGFVPILGPVEQVEPLYGREAARLALFNYRAARNFRNIWYHYPQDFERFRETLIRSWPEMDVELPEICYQTPKPTLTMFCPEKRIPREICWAGFGFQVWCQMLTHVIKARDKSLFMIDEPDIYLHSDLQRQLLGILRELGPDILIATHSVEMIADAEPQDIVLINKESRRARRIRQPSSLTGVFDALGSTLNPILTQLARTRRAIFVEGDDFKIIGGFARRLNMMSVNSQNHFAVIPVGGFNPDRIRSMKHGIEKTLGGEISAAALFDRDYRSNAEIASITRFCSTFCDYVKVHSCKEIENFLLVPSAIDRAAERQLTSRAERRGTSMRFTSVARECLSKFAVEQLNYVKSQFLASRVQFERSSGSGVDIATINEEVLKELDHELNDSNRLLKLIPGKLALKALNQALQEINGVTLTPSAIINAMRIIEIPAEMKLLVDDLAEFAQS